MSDRRSRHRTSVVGRTLVAAIDVNIEGSRLDVRPSLLHFSDREVLEMIGEPVRNRINDVAHNLARDRCQLNERSGFADQGALPPGPPTARRRCH